MFRYLDDLLLIFEISQDNFDINFYPKELELVDSSNGNDQSIDFLDLSISIHSNSISTNIFDKRNSYHLKINKITDFRTCLHTSVFRNII